MTLNTARKIENVLVWVIYVLTMPIGVLRIIMFMVLKLLEWMLEIRNSISFKVGNKLMLLSDAVKSGKIKDIYYLKNYTARQAWIMIIKYKRAL